MEECGFQYHMRLQLVKGERCFGPGVASIMRLVRELGSLSAACREMGMAYSKAWKIVRLAQEELGIALMEGSRGGESGGKTVLTPEGEAFLERFLSFEEEARGAIDLLFEKYYG